MATVEETKTLFAGLRTAMKLASRELRSNVSALNGMLQTINEMDSLNGDILAAADETALEAALLAARKKLLDVNGYVKTNHILVLDADGDPVLDGEGNPTFENVQTVVPGFLDKVVGYDQVDANGDPVLDDDDEQIHVDGIVEAIAALETMQIGGVSLRTALAMGVAATEPSQ